MARKLMNAVQYNCYGGVASLKHVEIPIPVPKKGEILLKLEATSLNPVNLTIQKGTKRPFFPRKFPFIPGTGVTKFKAGDKVVAFLSHLRYQQQKPLAYLSLLTLLTCPLPNRQALNSTELALKKIF
ncbi:hypothetical protein CsSME_00041489 [Camellia sinensis var. sinensis]